MAMRRVFVAAFGAALIFGGSCMAAPPPTVPATPTVPANDYLKAIHDACPTTTVPAQDGTVEPTVGCTRGLSLAPKGQAAPARSSHLSDLAIGFGLGSAELTPAGRTNAAHFAAALRDPSVSKLKFEIAGHADDTDSPAHNRALSQQRADAVRAYLISQGVDASRLTAKGYGSSELADPAKPKSAANRRVEARPL
jgi:outer membrane protein OmpA-like peptidoglycan-associated protein